MNLDPFEDIEERPMPRRARRRRSEKIKSREYFDGRSSGQRSRPAFATTKLRFTRFTGVGPSKAASHIKYLERESATTSATGKPIVAGNERLSNLGQPKKGEKRQFRLIVSPEEFFQMDPRSYITLFMDKLAKRAGVHRKGQRLRWASICHLNTAHPHYHVIISGAPLKTQ